MNLVEPIRDIKKIKEFRKNLKPMYLLIWDIGSKIGIRVSDILALNLNIIDKDQLTIREKKTNKLKKFPICPELKKEILNYYNKYRKNKPAYDNDALFVGVRGKRLCRKNVYREFNKAADKVKIDNVGTHTMRKTFGYHFYQQYHDVVMLQKILNHSSPSITLRYIGITQDEITKSYKNFKLNSEKIFDKVDKINNNAEMENLVLKKLTQNNLDKTILEYIQKQINEKLDILINNLCESR